MDSDNYHTKAETIFDHAYLEGALGACTIKHVGFAMYGQTLKIVGLLKLVCLSESVKVIGNGKYTTDLLGNMSIYCNVGIRNFSCAGANSRGALYLGGILGASSD